jgi:hypothetical protein
VSVDEFKVWLRECAVALDDLCPCAPSPPSPPPPLTFLLHLLIQSGS